jgi:rubrerythrin
LEQDKFKEIMDFAVRTEQEAVYFYQNLQKMSSFESQKEIMREFELMEKGHIEILKKITISSGTDASKIPDIENLSISEYLVEVPPKPDMDYQDILITAMKREERAFKLYEKLAAESGDEEIKNLFLRLASEEAKHKNHFEKIYDDDILTEN